MGELKILIYSCLYLGLSGQALGQETLVLSSVKGSIDAEVSIAVMKEAYDMIGINIEIREFGGKEALHASNSGMVDGEIERIDGISKICPNLRQVQIPINYFNLHAFSKMNNIVINGWYDLKPYKLGITEGMIITGQNTIGMDVKLYKNNQELFEMILADSIEIVVMPLMNGKIILNRMGISNIHALNKVIESLFLYHYLHKKHENLIPKLEKALKMMLFKGRMLQIRKETFDNIIKNQD